MLWTNTIKSRNVDIFCNLNYIHIRFDSHFVVVVCLGSWFRCFGKCLFLFTVNPRKMAATIATTAWRNEQELLILIKFILLFLCSRFSRRISMHKNTKSRRCHSHLAGITKNREQKHYISHPKWNKSLSPHFRRKQFRFSFDSCLCVSFWRSSVLLRIAKKKFLSRFSYHSAIAGFPFRRPTKLIQSIILLIVFLDDHATIHLICCNIFFICSSAFAHNLFRIPLFFAPAAEYNAKWLILMANWYTRNRWMILDLGVITFWSTNHDDAIVRQ